MAEHLSTVGVRKQRQILTRYRLSDHKLESQKRGDKKKNSWQPKGNRTCGHFLLQCETFSEKRNIYFNKFNCDFRFEKPNRFSK